MAEENSTTMNLDLNLGPVDNSSDDSEPTLESYPNGTMNLEDWLDNPARVRAVVRRNHRWRSLWRQIPIPPETRNLALELIGSNLPPETGEGSVAPDERRPDGLAKICETNAGFVEDDDASGKKKKDGGKNNGDDGGFFDCNICLDLAKDPVVTCCGHLFCWPCLYQWLHHHSDAKECPVCKGEVTMKNVTPIYGRGNGNSNNGNNNMREPGTDPSLKIPLRPHARRIESWRQAIQRSAFTIPMEEMIRRLGSTFDLSRELSQIQARNPDGPGESPERSNSNNSALLNRILTSRGMRRERAPSSDNVIDLTTEDNNTNNHNSNSNNNNNNNNHNRRLTSLLLRRSNSHRAASLSNLASALQSVDRLDSLAAVDSYFNSNPVERNQERAILMDDRDSVSSIAAVIHSESQTIDNAVEIDSTVSLSTSSSRRRHDVSRISDVDSGDSRAPRRRRLN